MNPGVTLERDGDIVIIRIPLQIKRRMELKEIIVPTGLADSQPLKAAPQEPLIMALARAFYWQDLIDRGRYLSIAALAEASGLSLERLVKGVPVAWEEQIERLGLSSM